MREVDMLPLLREILTEHKAASRRTGPSEPVFVTSTGRARSRDNLRHDVVDAVVAHANRLVDERGLQPLPLGITPHKLRHTFASILVAIGKDPTYVMQQLGHTDPAFTLRVYAHAMRRSEDERARLKALVEGHDWSHIGHKTAEAASARLKRDAEANVWRSLCGVIPSGSGCMPRSSASRCAWATDVSTTSWRRLCRERGVPVAVTNTGS